MQSVSTAFAPLQYQTMLTLRLWLVGELGDAGSLLSGLSTMEPLLVTEALRTASITPPLP